MSLTCRLCLSTTSVLTREHIPPKSAGNSGPQQLTAISFTSGSNADQSLPDGFALSVLCERCNSVYGSRLGTTFASFVQQVQRSGRFINLRGGVYALAMDVFPARVYRQLLLNYLCLHPPSDEGNLPAVREFVRSRDVPGDSIADALPRIGLYCNISSTYRIVPVGSIGALGKLKEPWLGAEIAAPGLGVVFSIGPTRDVHPAIKPKLEDVSSWGAEQFGSRRSVTLELPRYRVETAYPLGFGSPREVDKWQARYHVIWLATRFDTDSGSDMGAVLWKPDRMARKRR